MGRQMKLMPATYVKAFNIRHKNSRPMPARSDWRSSSRREAALTDRSSQSEQFDQGAKANNDQGPAVSGLCAQGWRPLALPPSMARRQPIALL